MDEAFNANNQTKESIDSNFLSNLNYVSLNLKKNIDEANNLDEKTYIELSKDEIIKYLNYVYKNIKDWQDNYDTKKYDLIIEKYKEIESIISQLEFCLADYDNKFHMDGISYSIFQIGKILSVIKKESDENGR